MCKVSRALVFLLFFVSCSKNENDVEKDAFYYFKSVVAGSPYETVGYRYTDDTGPNGPQLFIRKLSGDSLYVIVSVEEIAVTFPRPLQVGNINAYFMLAKKGVGIEGSYTVDRANYDMNTMTTSGGNPMSIDTSSSFSFVVADTSVAPFYGEHANGSYHFTLLNNGAKTSTSGTFRLKVP